MQHTAIDYSDLRNALAVGPATAKTVACRILALDSPNPLQRDYIRKRLHELEDLGEVEQTGNHGRAIIFALKS